MTYAKASHQAKYLAIVADGYNDTLTVVGICFDSESQLAYAVAHCGCYRTHPDKFNSEAEMAEKLRSNPEEFGVQEVL
jgi:hypothetical protein